MPCRSPAITPTTPGKLVERAAALAAEEVQHFRRVVAILRKRGWPLGGRRKNPWAQALRAQIIPGREPWTKVDRLLFGAMIEARSCERFTRLLEVVEDPEVEHLLADLGPAERRHWELFHKLAGREVTPEALAVRFQRWREFEADLARGLGISPPSTAEASNEPRVRRELPLDDLVNLRDRRFLDVAREREGDQREVDGVTDHRQPEDHLARHLRVGAGASEAVGGRDGAAADQLVEERGIVQVVRQPRRAVDEARRRRRGTR